MNLLFYDENIERMMRNVNYFILRRDFVITAVCQPTEASELFMSGDIIIIYESENLNSDFLLSKAINSHAYIYMVCGKEDSLGCMATLCINAKFIHQSCETKELYDFLCCENLSNKTPVTKYEKPIGKLLKMCAAPQHLQGYPFLENAIDLCCRNDNMLHGITKTLYPHIARQNNTSPQAVERSIRIVIERIWEGNEEAMNKLFNLKCTTRPTNKEFLHAAVRLIKEHVDELY